MNPMSRVLAADTLVLFKPVSTLIQMIYRSTLTTLLHQSSRKEPPSLSKSLLSLDAYSVVSVQEMLGVLMDHTVVLYRNFMP